MNEYNLGDAIRARRLHLRLTQEQLAERLSVLGDRHIRQSDISRIEHGLVQLPRRDRLLRLAEALEMSIGDLLTRAGWLNGDDGSEPSSGDDGGQQLSTSLPAQPARNEEGGRPEHRIRSLVEESHSNHSLFTRNQAEFARMRQLFEQSKREFEENARHRSQTDE